jgi:hypothetical protein
VSPPNVDGILPRELGFAKEFAVQAIQSANPTRNSPREIFARQIPQAGSVAGLI